MKNEKRNCKICEKELEVSFGHIGRGGKNRFSKTKTRSVTDSKDGVLFVGGEDKKYGYVWFCNECWNKMIVKFNKFKLRNKP